MKLPKLEAQDCTASSGKQTKSWMMGSLLMETLFKDDLYYIMRSSHLSAEG